MKKNKKIIIFIFLIVLIISIIFLLQIFLGKKVSRLEQYLEEHNVVNCLVIGIDSLEKTSRSDTIILISFNSLSGRFYATFIPRDSAITTSDGTRHKINALYSLGYRNGGTDAGIDRLRQGVENELGIEIPYYIQVDYDAFVKIIDIIGGVKIDIAEPMQYIDCASGLVIDLKPGLQVLDGRKSLEYVRFRADSKGDLGRIERQRQFLRALFRTVTRKKIIINSPKLVFIIYRKVYTNFRLNEIKFMLNFKEDLKKENLDINKFPGSPRYIDKISYYILNKDSWKKGYKDFQYKKHQQTESGVVTVELLNGSGINGAGRKIATYLRKLNYDVLFIDNADNQNYKETILYDRSGDIKQAEKLGDILGTDNVFTRKDPDSYVEVTVILGKSISVKLKEIKQR